MRYTQCQITHLGGIYNRIRLHDSFIGPIESVWTKSPNIIMQPTVWLAVVGWSVEGQEMFLTTTQLILDLR